MSAKVEVLADKPALCRRAAELFAERLEAAVAERGRFAVGLSGGATPLDLFDLLARPPYRGRLPWSKAHFFWVDERCVPPDDLRSSFGAAKASLLEPLGVPVDRVHRIRGELPPEEAARLYEGELRAFFGADPRFDLMLLGLGADGHTASLFPGSPELDASGWTAATGVSPTEPRVPRVTLTLNAIDRSRCAIFLASGASKARAVADALAGKGPAGRVRPEEGELLWLVDAEAAGR